MTNKLISRITTLLDSNAQFSTEAYKERGVWSIQRKKYKSMETVPGKNLMMNLVDEHFKITLLKMLKKQRKMWRKPRK